jgi:nicotinamidase-related amidase
VKVRKSAPSAGDLAQGRQSDTALLIIDVINSFEFETGGALDRALPIASPLRKLARRARVAGVPVIYANDNFGLWQSTLDQVIRRCMKTGGRASQFVKKLLPEPDDYCVLKPKHSAFFQTPLDLLLKHLQTRRVVLTGLWTHNCVLFTAHNAYMRDTSSSVFRWTALPPIQRRIIDME